MTSQKNDIFVSVREKLLEEGRNQLAEAPQDLKGNFKKQGGWAGAMIGAATGASLGAVVGPSIPELGLAAAVPVAVVFGIIGYFGGGKNRRKS